ncbi:capsid portal protein [Psychromonas sp. PRT-SC03]|nr:capsid portal protein [Psychromonas sp. PRT-SC03]
MLIDFGTPESVMNCNILDYMEIALIDGLYEPPIALDLFTKAARANALHGSALVAKSRMASSATKLSKQLSRSHYNRFLADYLTFGNGYLLAVRNAFGEIISFKHLPALFMRRAENIERYTYKPNEFNDDGRIDYAKGQVFHLAEYDASQEIYGLPQYIGALTSIWLNEDATVFRRCYYRNGSHAGYLLYMNDASITPEQEEYIRKTLEKSAGLGAFKNLFINGKGNNGKAPELTPIGQVEAKDAFKDVKNMTTNDILASHRIPLDLMSVVREGFSSSNDLNKVDRIFYKNELTPLLESVCELNDFAGSEVVSIKPYTALDATESDNKNKK